MSSGGGARDPVRSGYLCDLAPASSTLSDPHEAHIWEAVVDSFHNTSGKADGRPFTLAEMQRGLGDRVRHLQDRCREFEGVRHLPRAIASTIASPVDAIVVARTAYNLAGSNFEVFSSHALVGSDERMLAVARDSGKARKDQAWKVIACALGLAQNGDFELRPGAPVLATQYEPAGFSLLRRSLVANGVNYGMRVAPEQRFRNRRDDLDDPDTDDGGEYSALTRFTIAGSSSCRSTRPSVLEIADVLNESRLTYIRECLVEVSARGSGVHVLTRPSPWPPPADVEPQARALAEQVSALPSAPLSKRYRGHEFHHAHDAPWETMLMVAALARSCTPL